MEPNRPLIHFTPPMNWMNDPNGLVYYDGEYHLFYQHNPYGKDWGHMSWGHAVSADLLRWKHLPIAIMEEPRLGYTIFSGSAVVDWHDTSGFGRGGRPPMVAVYTADHQPNAALEDIHIASSLDRGRTFAKYPHNPVLDAHNPKFGDPKVFWHAPTGRWILAAIHGVDQGWVDFYGSPDLKSWEWLSQFRAPDAAPGIWECPDLFPVPAEPEVPGAPDRWVLKVNSVTPDRGPVITRYFVGEFDGRRFDADPTAAQQVNPDVDHIYAEATYNDIPASDGRRILIGWVRQTSRDDRAWTGMQSIPRELSLRRIDGALRLCQAPIAELAGLRTRHVELNAMPVSGSAPILERLELGQGAWDILADLEPAGAGECGLRFHLPRHAVADAGYSAATAELFVEQTGKPRLSLPYFAGGDQIRLRVILDRGIVEVFGGAGQATITAAVDPETACIGVDAFARDGVARIDHIDLWKLL